MPTIAELRHRSTQLFTVDRCPDTRDMGYPFARPFAGSIPSPLLRLPSAAGRSLTIGHEES